jgi:hypothetical protein
MQKQTTTDLFRLLKIFQSPSKRLRWLLASRRLGNTKGTPGEIRPACIVLLCYTGGNAYHLKSYCEVLAFLNPVRSLQSGRASYLAVSLSQAVNGNFTASIAMCSSSGFGRFPPQRYLEAAAGHDFGHTEIRTEI